MPLLDKTTKPLLHAALATGLAVAAYAALRAAGVDPQESLVAGLIVAGLLNIHGLVTLNGEPRAPTSG